jgi:hypothetical protein
MIEFSQLVATARWINSEIPPETAGTRPNPLIRISTDFASTSPMLAKFALIVGLGSVMC